jgi:hypothetical protein
MRGAQSGKPANLDIRDSGEHGIYVAGSPNANRDLSFTNVKITRPGQCGLKIRNIAAKTIGISIDGLTVQDAHYGNRAGWNEDGLRIELAEDVSVTGFSLSRKRNSKSSAHDGIYISGSSNVRIVAPEISDVENTGIRISDGGNSQSMTGIIIESPRISGTRFGHGIQIQASNAGTELGRLLINDAIIGDTAGYAVEVDVGESGIIDQVNISGIAQSADARKFNNVQNTGKPRLNVLLEDARYED